MRQFLSTAENIVIEIIRSLANGDEPEISPDASAATWGEVIAVAARHKVLPLVMNKAILLDQRGFHNCQLHKLAADILHLNIHRKNVHWREVQTLWEHFNSRGIPSIPRKGVLYDIRIYGNSGIRRNNDIDFFLPAECKIEASQLLRDLGYQRGRFSQRENKIVDLQREELALYSLYPDHLPPQGRLTSDPFVPFIKVDIASDMSWSNAPISTTCEGLLGSALNAAKKASGKCADCAPLWFHFLDCCLHLFREAYFAETIFSNNSAGVTLHKFLDVALLWNSLGSTDIMMMKDCMISKELGEIIGWVAIHTDNVLRTEVASGLCAEQLPTPTFLQSWIRKDGSVGHWSGSMLNRCFSDAGVIFS